MGQWARVVGQCILAFASPGVLQKGVQTQATGSINVVPPTHSRVALVNQDVVISLIFINLPTALLTRLKINEPQLV